MILFQSGLRRWVWMLTLVLPLPWIVLGMTAAPLKKLQFSLSGKAVMFFQDDSQRLMVSADCYPMPVNWQSACESLRAIRRASVESYGATAAGMGANPGEALCESRLGGHVVVGIREHAGENAFCSFSDGSAVDLGTLVHYANRSRARQ